MNKDIESKIHLAQLDTMHAQLDTMQEAESYYGMRLDKLISEKNKYKEALQDIELWGRVGNLWPAQRAKQALGHENKIAEEVEK